MIGLPEKLEVINERLLTKWGKFSTTESSLWRVVWSEDQLEKRWMTHTKDGFQYLEPQVGPKIQAVDSR